MDAGGAQRSCARSTLRGVPPLMAGAPGALGATMEASAIATVGNPRSAAPNSQSYCDSCRIPRTQRFPPYVSRVLPHVPRDRACAAGRHGQCVDRSATRSVRKDEDPY